MSEGRKGRCGWSWWYLLLWVIVGAVLTAVVYVPHIALQLVGRPDRRQGYSRSLIFKC